MIGYLQTRLGLLFALILCCDRHGLPVERRVVFFRHFELFVRYMSPECVQDIPEAEVKVVQQIRIEVVANHWVCNDIIHLATLLLGDAELFL